MSVEHHGVRFEPIAVILDAHLPNSAAWRVEWDGEVAHVITQGGGFDVESGRPWGPYCAVGGTVPPVVREAMRAVRGPLYDRLIARMCGRSA